MPRPLVTSARASVADALFSTTQQRVLSLLFGQPDRSFFTKELIDLTGSGSGAVQRELARLRDSGLVVQTTLGNQKHYQANAKSPIFPELRGLATKMLGPAETLRQTLAPLADQLQLALLYGSVAKRSDTVHSDFDLLLVSDTLGLEQVYAALAQAEKQLGRAISPTLYTQDEFRQRLARRNSFLTRVLADATITLIGDKDVTAAAR
ncbi:MAG: transcriptional regulator [Rhodanobacter denitrificans]|uniref:Transcriptional regulator n=1 Tax=Rhodanobacter denitrificans TaxID=666685 RepID=A0A2W5KLX8_9GAMM|nr:MAG: transcriptional regulator [Rhodanobacter denitrificans]